MKKKLLCTLLLLISTTLVFWARTRKDDDTAKSSETTSSVTTSKTTGTHTTKAEKPLSKLSVAGNRIVTEEKREIRLRGVNFEDPFLLDKGDANGDGFP